MQDNQSGLDSDLPAEDYRLIFEPAARASRMRWRVLFVAGFVPGALIAFGLMIQVMRTGQPWYYYVAVLGGWALWMFTVVAVLPRPWPSCPGCGDDFHTIGSHCPYCCREMQIKRPGKEAECPRCGEIVVMLFSRGPLWYKRKSDGTHSQSHVPLRYCMQCRACLSN
jgi:hypothetical protein